MVKTEMKQHQGVTRINLVMHFHECKWPCNPNQRKNYHHFKKILTLKLPLVHAKSSCFFSEYIVCLKALSGRNDNTIF